MNTRGQQEGSKGAQGSTKGVQGDIGSLSTTS